jgi:hypothetical protein
MDKKKIITELKKLPSDEAKAVWLLGQVEKLEEQFEEATDRIEDKCQRIISELPKEIQKYAKIGLRYSGFIDRFKSAIAIDSMVIDEEVKGLLMMAKAEIQKLRSEKSAIIRDTTQSRKDVKEMKLQLYAWHQIEKLKTDNQRKQAKKLCENATSKNKIDTVIREVKNAKRN